MSGPHDQGSRGRRGSDPRSMWGFSSLVAPTSAPCVRGSSPLTLPAGNLSFSRTSPQGLVYGVCVPHLARPGTPSSGSTHPSTTVLVVLPALGVHSRVHTACAYTEARAHASDGRYLNQGKRLKVY